MDKLRKHQGKYRDNDKRQVLVNQSYSCLISWLLRLCIVLWEQALVVNLLMFNNVCASQKAWQECLHFEICLKITVFVNLWYWFRICLYSGCVSYQIKLWWFKINSCIWQSLRSNEQLPGRSYMSLWTDGYKEKDWQINYGGNIAV